MMKLRSIEMTLPGAAEAAAFLGGQWGMPRGELVGDTWYLRGSGPEAYLVALKESSGRSVQTVTFIGEAVAVAALADRARRQGAPVELVSVVNEPGGGEGVIVTGPDGERFRFLSGVGPVEPLPAQRDMPRRLTHVVLNATDAEASGDFVEQALGFKVSDRTRGMVFVRCDDSHHSTAFARAGFASLNHIAFEMEDIDAVMRGVGRMRDIGLAAAWGPGRHGPGDNVFAYFIAPFGPVIEYSTAVEKVDETYTTGAPEDWTWPENRIDQWGLGGKDLKALGEAERLFRFPGAPVESTQ
jgi:catechol 2,3-dioxygenase-like lactoylglutathione lyase family enzyme